MAKIINNARFCNLIDEHSNWSTYNPILRSGELGIVTQTDGGKTIGVIGNGQSTITDLLSSFDDNLIYFGKGAQYELMAAGSSLGGVKNGELHKTGIDIRGGIIYNDLMDNWNDNENCYVIDKLQVGKLLCDDITENTVFSGDTITLRYIDPDTQEEPTLLEDDKISGIMLMNISKDENNEWINGYFGMDNKMDFYVQRGENKYILYPFDSIYPNNITGLCCINAEMNTTSIVTPQNLIFKNDYWASGNPEDEGYEESKQIIYNPADLEITIDLTPPTITVAEGDVVTYDAETNTYNLVLDGGITAENAVKLSKIDPLEEKVNLLDEQLTALDEQKLNPEDVVIEGEGKINVTRDGDKTTFSVAHNTTNVNMVNAGTFNVSSGITYTFITGIEVDEYGHVTKINTTNYIW